MLVFISRYLVDMNSDKQLFSCYDRLSNQFRRFRAFTLDIKPNIPAFCRPSHQSTSPSHSKPPSQATHLLLFSPKKPYYLFIPFYWHIFRILSLSIPNNNFPSLFFLLASFLLYSLPMPRYSQSSPDLFPFNLPSVPITNSLGRP